MIPIRNPGEKLMYHPPSRKYDSDVWLKKRSNGKRTYQIFTIVVTGIALALILLGLNSLLLYGRNPLIEISWAAVLLIFTFVGIKAIINKEYYHLIALLMLKENRVPFKEGEKFVKNFISDRKLGIAKKRNKKKNETIYLAHKKEVSIMIFKHNGRLGVVSISDIDGTNSDLVREFMDEFNLEFDLVPNEQDIFSILP